MSRVPPEIFKAYDIRGVVGTSIDENFAEHLGRAFGSMALQAGEKAVAVGTPEQVVERLGKIRDLGLGYSIHYFADAAYDRSSQELFEREVIPALS